MHDKNKDQFNYRYSRSKARSEPTIYYYGPVSNLKQRTAERLIPEGDIVFVRRGMSVEKKTIFKNKM